MFGKGNVWFHGLTLCGSRPLFQSRHTELEKAFRQSVYLVSSEFCQVE